MVLASNLKDIAKDPSKSDFKFRNASLQDRQDWAKKGNELQQIAIDRDNIENKNKSKGFNSRGSLGAGGANTQKNGLVLNNSGSATPMAETPVPGI